MIGALRILALLSLMVPVLAGAFAAQAYSDKPLMVIRFNQPKVHFENSLYTAVEKAVEAKPSVMFDVVSHVPTGDGRLKAEKNLQDVLRALLEVGVPQSRFTVRREMTAGLMASEVHIFVR